MPQHIQTVQGTLTKPPSSGYQVKQVDKQEKQEKSTLKQHEDNKTALITGFIVTFALLYKFI